MSSAVTSDLRFMAAQLSAPRHCRPLFSPSGPLTSFPNKHCLVFNKKKKKTGKRSKLLLSYKEDCPISTWGQAILSNRVEPAGASCPPVDKSSYLVQGVGERRGGTERQWEDCGAGRMKGSGLSHPLSVVLLPVGCVDALPGMEITVFPFQRKWASLQPL